MFTATEPTQIPASTNVKSQPTCYHCGTLCLPSASLRQDDKDFCCEGCKLVYEILQDNGMCDYYNIASHPGLSQVKPLRTGKYEYLDDEKIASQLYQFTDGNNNIVTLFIPGIHCSSCMWLLENLHRLNDGITNSRIDFSAKEVTISFRQNKINLRGVAELLATIGYEPQISLESKEHATENKTSKETLYKLGIAGFCFGNIMLMSFPEYLSADGALEYKYALLFRILNLILSVPVVFYSASIFFKNAWAGLKQRMLNIDAPIVLAIIITYGRSLYEIFSGTGGGYLDSMSGIIFFMLVGRVVQERTYRSLSFHRDYKAYFPIAATVIEGDKIVSKQITELQKHDVVKVYSQELIPADGIIVSGNAYIDYSFVTGENDPVNTAAGQKVFAGGRQLGEAIVIEVHKPVTTSYLTSLWNHQAFSKDKGEQDNRESHIHTLSKYFTVVLFTLAAITALYWWAYNPQLILPSVSAMLIVACPCALLLTVTYTNGNILRLLSDNGLYLRDAGVIEQLGSIKHLVFDKTGTLTKGGSHFSSKGHTLTDEEKRMVFAVAEDSSHPKSRQLAAHFLCDNTLTVDQWTEHAGKGISAVCNGAKILIGSAAWIGANEYDDADVLVKIDERVTAFYWQAAVRDEVDDILRDLRKDYDISLLSGDNDRHRNVFERFFDNGALYFEQTPVDKLQFIEALQQNGQKVAMIGDGLNDAGALKQSNVGITLADDINNFSPSCDAILQANKLQQLPALLRLAKYSKVIIYASFIVSIIYNIAGVSISMTGHMNPMIAAILMPLSTISIVLITTIASNILAARLGLSTTQD